MATPTPQPAASRLRVLMIAHALPPTLGGVETHVDDVVRHLVARGHTVSCVVGGGESDEERSGARVHRRRCLTAATLIGRPSEVSVRDEQLASEIRSTLESVVAELEPDIVHVHNAHHFRAELTDEAFAIRDDVPLINAIHDSVGERMLPGVLRRPWTLTLYASAYLGRALPVDTRSSVRHLGIDLERFTPEGATEASICAAEHPVILHPARLLAWKGPEIALDAFVRVRRTLGNGTLVLSGGEDVIADGAELAALRGRLDAAARRERVRDHVLFACFAHEDMPSVYRSADIVWYPSTGEEPYGLVPIEAMACGTPVVVSASGGMLETVEHGRSGLIVERGSAAALAEATASILCDADLAERLRIGGLSRAAQFDIASYARFLEHLYATLRRRSRFALTGGGDG